MAHCKKCSGSGQITNDDEEYISCNNCEGTGIVVEEFEEEFEPEDAD